MERNGGGGGGGGGGGAGVEISRVSEIEGDAEKKFISFSDSKIRNGGLFLFFCEKIP